MSVYLTIKEIWRNRGRFFLFGLVIALITILVLADEPTASLDTERANQVVQIFADLIHEQGKAGIMVTHDLRMCQFVTG